MLAPEGAEELKGPAPPRTLAVYASVIGLRRRHVQGARKFALVLVLHRREFRLPTHAQPNDATQTASSYAVVMRRTQGLFGWLSNLFGAIAGAVVGADRRHRLPDQQCARLIIMIYVRQLIEKSKRVQIVRPPLGRLPS